MLCWGCFCLTQLVAQSKTTGSGVLLAIVRFGAGRWRITHASLKTAVKYAIVGRINLYQTDTEITSSNYGTEINSIIAAGWFQAYYALSYNGPIEVDGPFTLLGLTNTHAATDDLRLVYIVERLY